MRKQNIKTVALVFKNMKSFAYGCCDEIIEHQDVEFQNNLDIITTFKNVLPNDSYSGNDGSALQYIRGITCKQYEDILDKIDFQNIFYTLHLDGSRYINKIDSVVFSGAMHLYKIMNENCVVHDVTNPTPSFCLPIPQYDSKRKTRKIGIWIRNTNKHEFRNMLPDTYNTVFNYCMQNQIICNVFMDLVPIELPKSDFIINCTNRFKNRPNWDVFLQILNDCDFYIGTDSGSSEFVLLNAKLNCLFDRNIRSQKQLNEIVSANHQQGLICKKICFPTEFATIMNEYYRQ
jgi:hypothetical protein